MIEVVTLIGRLLHHDGQNLAQPPIVKLILRVRFLWHSISFGRDTTPVVVLQIVTVGYPDSDLQIINENHN